MQIAAINIIKIFDINVCAKRSIYLPHSKSRCHTRHSLSASSLFSGQSTRVYMQIPQPLYNERLKSMLEGLRE